MLTLLSEKTGTLHFQPDRQFGLDGILGMTYEIHEASERKIVRSSYEQDSYHTDLLIYRSDYDDSIIIADIKYPYILIAIFGYGITLFLTPGLKREMQDRSANLFYSTDLKCRIRLQKNREYRLVLLQCSKSFIDSLEEGGGEIRTSWDQVSPAYYSPRSRIIKRNAMELLSILIFPVGFCDCDDVLRDEVAKAFLSDFVNDHNASFQPAHLTTAELNVFYMERDQLIQSSVCRGTLPKLLKKSGIHFITLFRKRIKQLYQLNITQFVTELRITRAAVLLMDPTLSIKEIAEKTGFPNASYFSRIFNRYYGLSPRAFRGQF
jgi:AraC-like DNA-binding protein